ncbi:hypothetical protein BE20_01165 [Sorangium cellulosum]|nr:hypothetical protein BE20_01165 [Sorangium cellulosum]
MPSTIAGSSISYRAAWIGFRSASRSPSRPMGERNTSPRVTPAMKRLSSATRSMKSERVERMTRRGEEASSATPSRHEKKAARSRASHESV